MEGGEGRGVNWRNNSIAERPMTSFWTNDKNDEYKKRKIGIYIYIFIYINLYSR